MKTIEQKYADYRKLVEIANEAKKAMEFMQRQHFALYEVHKPADEPHDETCQKHESRYGDIKGVACTCQSNVKRRRETILAAGKAGDKIVLESLGSLERTTWFIGFGKKED